MLARIQLASVPYVPSSPNQVYLRGLPSGAKLVAIEIDSNFTAITQGGGGGLTALQLHNLIQNLTISDGSEPWGPVAISGERVAQTHYFASGIKIPYTTDANGDQAVAAGAGPTPRRFRQVYDYRVFAPKDDQFAFCPPTDRMKGGNVAFTFAATPANNTLLTGSYTVYAWVKYTKAKGVAARIKTIAQAFVGTGFDLTASGLLLQLVGRDANAILAADFTGLRLYADGMPLVTLAAHPGTARPDALEKANSAAILNGMQETFSDPIGGAFPRALALYPAPPRSPLGDLPTAQSYKLEFEGALVVADWSATVTYVERLSQAEREAQVDSCGCSAEEKAGSVLIPTGRGGSVLTSTRLQGYAPEVLVPRGSAMDRIRTALMK